MLFLGKFGPFECAEFEYAEFGKFENAEFGRILIWLSRIRGIQ